jgi:hypothetical protein
LRVFGRLHGVADLEARIAALAAELDLVDRETGKLASGQRTRVALGTSSSAASSASRSRSSRRCGRATSPTCCSPAGRSASSCRLLPPTYVFEGMRALLIDHVFRADLMIEALALNVVFFLGGAAAFMGLLKSARRSGALMQGGE